MESKPTFYRHTPILGGDKLKEVDDMIHRSALPWPHHARSLVDPGGTWPTGNSMIPGVGVCYCTSTFRAAAEGSW
jgi:hypothetical protein